MQLVYCAVLQVVDVDMSQVLMIFEALCLISASKISFPWSVKSVYNSSRDFYQDVYTILNRI